MIMEDVRELWSEVRSRHGRLKDVLVDEVFGPSRGHSYARLRGRRQDVA